LIETSGAMAKDGVSGPVHCRMQAFDFGDGRIHWAGWVNPAEGHPHWNPIVVCDGPYTLITKDGLEVDIGLCNTEGFFKGVQRAKASPAHVHRVSAMYPGWTEWFVTKNADGTFAIFKDGELYHPAVPDHRLERQLAPHGIFQDDFREMASQLAETGHASISIPPLGKFYMG
jgi:hypothetical protein